jgi:hypothetical protein
MQRPWQNSSLEGDLYFVPPPVVAAAPSTQTLVTLEGVFWDTIKASRNPADFNAYVKRFPKGIFVVNFYADAAQARDWYRKAAELGSADAVQRLRELTLSNR